MAESAKSLSYTPAGFVFFEGQEKPRQYVVFQKAFIQGQSEMDVFTTSSLQLTYPFLDREQAEISCRDGEWYFKNLSSEVFTFVGGKNIKKDQEILLEDHTVIRFSNDRMLTAVFFKNFAASTDWKIINLDDGRHIVEIVDEEAGGKQVAMRFRYDASNWWLEEVGDQHVLLNGKDVDGATPIQFDDCIESCGNKFIFEGSGLLYGYPTFKGGLSIQIDERSVHQIMKKIDLLRDINLSIEPGNMVLILGGSGAGKSTFVNAVTGYEKAKAIIQEGDIDYYKQYDQVKHRIGFVPQDNLLREEDTVLDTVRNAADIRLPVTMPAEEKERRVHAVLETFGLSGRETEMVSKLSGGQKKRLSICTEFVASPSLFILDEPDSGLDGIMATELMQNLRLIACQGRIVLVITHAPDRVAHLFDKVIVLAKGTENQVGQLAFYGGIQEARDFFGVSTMEGVVKCINATNEGGEGRADEFIRKYREYSKLQAERSRTAYMDSEEEKKSKQADKSAQEPAEQVRYKGRLEQIPVYLGKQMRLFVSEGNWKVLIMSAIIAYLVVYVIGRKMFVDMEGTTYAALAIMCVCIWNGVFNSIQVVCKERSIIKREHRAGLHISAYLASHMIYQSMLCLLQVVITIIIFLLFKVKIPERSIITGVYLLDLAITMFLITYASDMIGLMISCIVHTPMMAMTVMPFLLIVQLVFAGSIFPLNALGQKLSNLTISNWGIRALCSVSDYNGQESSVLSTALNTMNSGDGTTMIDKVKRVMDIDEVRHKIGQVTARNLQKESYAFTVSNVWKSWGVLIIMIFGYVLIGMLFLEQIDRDKR